MESDALSASSGSTSLAAKIDKRKKVEEEAAHKVKFYLNRVIKYDFPSINICKVPRELLKTAGTNTGSRHHLQVKMVSV